MVLSEIKLNNLNNINIQRERKTDHFKRPFVGGSFFFIFRYLENSVGSKQALDAQNNIRKYLQDTYQK